MKTSTYEERIKLIGEFLKANPLNTMDDYHKNFATDKSTVKYQKGHTSYDSVCNILWLCGIDCSNETIEPFTSFKKSEKLCKLFVNKILKENLV